jgi:lauroyl/myristoyl acyltransferase
VCLLKIQAIDTIYEHPGWKTIRRGLGQFEGVRILKTCSRHLKEGGWVGAAFDVNETINRMIEVPFFGRAVPYPLGIPVLAVSTGAPVVSLVARWALDEPRIKIQIHEPIRWQELAPEGGSAAERAILGVLVSRMEAFFRAYPTELSRSKVGVLLKFPKMN